MEVLEFEDFIEDVVNGGQCMQILYEKRPGCMQEHAKKEIKKALGE